LLGYSELADTHLARHALEVAQRLEAAHPQAVVAQQGYGNLRTLGILEQIARPELDGNEPRLFDRR
jgi:hypothetical protein